MRFTGHRQLSSRQRPRAGAPAFHSAVLLVIYLLIPSHAMPQSAAEPSAKEVKRATVTADSLRLLGQYDDALAALGALPPLADPKHATWVKYWRARVIYSRGDLDTAEALLRETLSEAEAQDDSAMIATVLSRLASVIDDRGFPPRIVPLYERLIAISEKLGFADYVASANISLGRRHIRLGEYDKARPRIETALETAASDVETLDQELAARNLLGILEARSGNHDAARAAWEKNLEVARRHDHPYYVAQSYTNLGREEISRGDPAKAVEYWNEAYRIFISENKTRAALPPGNNAAVALRESGRYLEAAAMFQDLLATAREHGYRDQEGAALVNLGDVARLCGRLGESARYYREALAVIRELRDPEFETNALIGLATALSELDSNETAEVLLGERYDHLIERISPEKQAVLEWQYGDLFNRLADHPRALYHLNRSVRIAGELSLDRTAIQALPIAAESYRALGYPDSARACLARSSELWEAERSRPSGATWREIQGSRGALTCTGIADLLLVYPDSIARPERLCAAFDALQRFKARTLLERLTHEQEEGAEALAAAVGVDELQRQILRPGELMLEFFYGPLHSFLFAVTPGEVRVVQLPGWETGFYQIVERYHHLLSTPPERSAPKDDRRATLEAASRSVADQLMPGLEDLLAEADRIIFIPDGPLHRLAVGTLRPGGAAEPLLARCEIARVPSCALLAMLRENGERDTAATSPHPRSLAIADRHGAEGGKLTGTIREAKALARRYRNVDLRIPGEEGGTSLAPADLAPYRLLHLAAHVEVDDQRPWYSAVRVGADPDDKIRASRIASMELGARLAVLSGCETGGGRVMSGEGILGLSSAFLCAGVPAVVATLWPVSDGVTAHLMNRFYENLADGLPAGAALRSAQLALRADEATAHPFYWAGFSLAGDGDVSVPLERNSAPLVALIAAAIVIAAAAAFVLARRRK